MTMPTIIDGESYLTFQEVSNLLGVSRQTIDSYVKSKRLKKYRKGMGRTVYFKEDEVNNLLRMRQVDGE